MANEDSVLAQAYYPSSACQETDDGKYVQAEDTLTVEYAFMSKDLKNSLCCRLLYLVACGVWVITGGSEAREVDGYYR